MDPAIDPVEYFRRPGQTLHRLYEALRAYYVENLTAEEVGKQFDYSTVSVRVMASRFVHGKLGPFFREIPRGCQTAPVAGTLKDIILELRKQNLSILDISDHLTAGGRKASYHTVWRVLRAAGEKRLPRRTEAQRSSAPKIHPPIADIRILNLSIGREVQCQAPLLLLFAPLLTSLRFDELVVNAGYPGSFMIPAPAYIRSLLALKLMPKIRKNHVMSIAEDEGFGLFAGLNVLPKTTALSDYSSRMGPEPHRSLLGGFVHARDIMDAYQSLSFNIDFHTIRHFGDPECSRLENDYCTRRSQSVPAVTASFAQEWKSREMVYSHTNVLKREKSEEVLRFVEYWKKTTGKTPQELVFDARLTTHDGLAKLAGMGIRFLTLRERHPEEVARIMALPPKKWTRIEIDIPNREYRTPLVHDERIELSDYPGKIRQICAMNLGHDEPTFILTNDVRHGPKVLLTRYFRRTRIENSLAEQVRFFHIDSLSSSVRIKVDMDVVLSVLGSGCYRWLASKLRGFENSTARMLWDTFLDRHGTIRLTQDHVIVRVRRFSRAPVLLESEVSKNDAGIPWLGGRKLKLEIK